MRLKSKIILSANNKRTLRQKMTDMKIRNAHITIFPKDGNMTFTQDEIDKIYNNNIDTDKITYYIVQGEYTKDKRQHLQIYAQFKTQMRYAGIKKAFDDNTLHIEPIKYGKVEDCRRYCTDEYRDKDGNAKDIWMEYKEYGEIKYQGKRVDLENSINRIKTGEKVNKMLLEDDTRFAMQYAQYFRTFDKIEKLVQTDNAKKRISTKYDGVQWKQWQQSILDKLQQEPDERKIHWYYDRNGNIGKSYLTKYLGLNDDTFMINGGKKQDILYSYNGEKNIIFDLPRDTEDKDYIYEVMETLKNGQYLSTKYSSEQRIYETPHIIVFSNYHPDKTKLSNDRWDIIDITNNIVNVEPNDNFETKDDSDDNDEDIIIAPPVMIPPFAFKCHICDARFQRNYSLKEHIREHYINTDDTDNKNNKEYN